MLFPRLTQAQQLLGRRRLEAAEGLLAWLALMADTDEISNGGKDLLHITKDLEVIGAFPEWLDG